MMRREALVRDAGAPLTALKGGSECFFSEDIDSSIRFMHTKAVGDLRKMAQPRHPPAEP